jgi:hypothetical protein
MENPGVTALSGSVNSHATFFFASIACRLSPLWSVWWFCGASVLRRNTNRVERSGNRGHTLLPPIARSVL